jgi:uncharacterized protein
MGTERVELSPNANLEAGQLNTYGFSKCILVPVCSKDTVTLNEKDMNDLKRSYQRMAEVLVDSIKTGHQTNCDDFYYYINMILNSTCRYQGCGAGLSMISVTQNGEVFSCYKLSGEPEACMGNVFDEKIISSIPGLHYPDFLEEIKECSYCEVRNLCGGGCLAQSYLSDKYHQYKNLANSCEIFKWKFLISIWIISHFEKEELNNLH